MSSLRSMLLDPRAPIALRNMKGAGIDESIEEFERVNSLMEFTRMALEYRGTILVNAQKVLDDATGAIREYAQHPSDTGPAAFVNNPSLIPCPKPPFHQMWLEAFYGRPRIGALVLREDLTDPAHYAAVRAEIVNSGSETIRTAVLTAFDKAQPSSMVTAHAWFQDTDGTGYLCVGHSVFFLNGEGNFQYSFRQSHHVLHGPPDKAVGLLKIHQLWVMLTMARLNCRNVKLAPRKDSAPQAKKHVKPHAPCSVWHEIVVTEDAQYRRARAANPADAEKHAVRLHKVRGHFADYRKGAGLFGKYKILIWVDEHTAGDQELGTVVTSYRVE